MSSLVPSHRTSMFEIDMVRETIEETLLAKTDTTPMSLKRDYRSPSCVDSHFRATPSLGSIAVKFRGPRAVYQSGG